MLLITYGVLSVLLNLTITTITIITGYKNLVDRHETRQAAWQMPGWDECVLRTGKHDPIGWHLKLIVCCSTIDTSYGNKDPISY